MVLLRSKKLLLFSGVVLLFLMGIAVYFLVVKDNRADEPSLQSTAKSAEEIASLTATSKRFESLAEVANSSDSAVKLQASQEFARSSDNNTTSRLDAYRLCIQVAKEVKDISSQEACFSEALTLAQTLQIEADKTFWVEYINEVNSGIVNSGDEADDDNQ